MIINEKELIFELAKERFISECKQIYGTDYETFIYTNNLKPKVMFTLNGDKLLNAKAIKRYSYWNDYFVELVHKFVISDDEIIDLAKSVTTNEQNNANPNCPNKCNDVYLRKSGISKCKDCGKVFY